MHATSSQVTTAFVSTPSVLALKAVEEEPGAYILPTLKRDAKASGRDHLLVRRRRRDRRQKAR